jgi:hypothetical protein
VADPQPSVERNGRRSTRKHSIILTVILLVLVSAIGITWWGQHQNSSKDHVVAEAVQHANDAARATGRVPDIPATEASAHVVKCDNGAGGYSGDNASVSATISNVGDAEASRMADAFAAYLRREGYKGIDVERPSGGFDISGAKDGVLVGMLYNPTEHGHVVQVSAMAGCPV